MLRDAIDNIQKTIDDAEIRNQRTAMCTICSTIDNQLMKNNLTPISKKHYIYSAAARLAHRLPAALSGGAVRVSAPQCG